MLTILPAPDHVAAYRLMQTLTGEDVDAIMADIGTKLAHHEKIGVLVDLNGKDRYDSPDAQGQSGTNEYHFDADHVLSFSVLLDRGGDDDTYSTARANGAATVTSPADAPATAATRSYGVCIDI